MMAMLHVFLVKDGTIALKSNITKSADKKDSIANKTKSQDGGDNESEIQKSNNQGFDILEAMQLQKDNKKQKKAYFNSKQLKSLNSEFKEVFQVTSANQSKALQLQAETKLKKMTKHIISPRNDNARAASQEGDFFGLNFEALSAEGKKGSDHRVSRNKSFDEKDIRQSFIQRMKQDGDFVAVLYGDNTD